MENQEIAAQLRCPQGDAGLLLGQVMNLRNLPMILGALEQLDIRDGHRILEPGCGNGGLLGHILSQARGLHYTGLEISATMAKAARDFNAPFIEAGMAEYLLLERDFDAPPDAEDWRHQQSDGNGNGRPERQGGCASTGIDRADAVTKSRASADDAGLPFGDAVFDRIFSVNTVYFQASLSAWLAELCRVLKPSGRLCLTFAERDFMQKLPFAAHGFRLFDADEIEAMASALPLQKLAKVNQRDIAVSKGGQLVERPFVHLVFERY
ncbi:MAG: class I SAM-dependent methyltransferase [Lautropia sp.]|nr:class I SAM-dependent methyltransferase [Lautropia sp.]